MDLTLSAIEKDGDILVNMIEMGAKEVVEKDVMEAYEVAKKELKKMIEVQIAAVKKIGKTKKNWKTCFPNLLVIVLTTNLQGSTSLKGSPHWSEKEISPTEHHSNPRLNRCNGLGVFTRLRLDLYQDQVVSSQRLA